MRLILTVVGIVAAAAFPIVWPVETSGQQPGPAARRDQAVVFLAGEPDTLNPLFVTGTGSEIVATLFTTDVQLNETWKLFPQGVEYLPSLKDGTWRLDGERMTLVWKLRPRTWHDGRPVTCADYVFTYNVIRNTQVSAALSSGYEDHIGRIAHMACTKGAAGREIAVTWKERTITARESIIGGLPLPRHIVEPYYRANPAELHKARYGTDPTVTVGDGAYRLTEWRRGESIKVESVNAHPIFGTPRIKRIVFRVSPVAPGALRTALILRGDVDLLAVGPSAISILKAQGAGRVRIVSRPTLVWEHIDFNLDNPLLRDVRVRRAIAHAINRTQIVQQVWLGYAGTSHTYLPPGHPGFTGDVQTYPYDPARARILLQEAGFTPGAEGIVRNAAGQRLALDLSTTSGVAIHREQIERVVQEQLRQVGIEITIVNFPSRVFFGEFTRRRRFTGLALYAWVFAPSSDCNLLYTSDGIPHAGNGWEGQNFAGYRNAEMDEVCKAASHELDESRRSQLLKRSARIFSRDLPALPLNVLPAVAAVRVGLENITWSGESPFTWNAHAWYWR